MLTHSDEVLTALLPAAHLGSQPGRQQVWKPGNSLWLLPTHGPELKGSSRGPRAPCPYWLSTLHPRLCRAAGWGLAPARQDLGAPSLPVSESPSVLCPGCLSPHPHPWSSPFTRLRCRPLRPPPQHTHTHGYTVHSSGPSEHRRLHHLLHSWANVQSLPVPLKTVLHSTTPLEFPNNTLEFPKPNVHPPAPTCLEILKSILLQHPDACS